MWCCNFVPACSSCSALSDFDGRFVLGEFTFRDSVFRLACCYAPNRNPDRDAFFHRCIDSIDPSVPTLLCGDFNTVPDRFIDRRGSCPFDTSRESSNLLSFLFRDCCVVDIWRLKHPEGVWFYMVQEGWLLSLPYRSCWVPLPLDLLCFFCRHTTLPLI